MEDYQLLIDLYQHTIRQGPGGDAQTMLAMELAGIDPAAPLKIADIGCGTGASTLLLASRLNAQLTAVDLLEEFLQVLQKRAAQADLSGKITTQACSMDNLPFEDGAYDVIWSEGAVYNIGFETGLKGWKRYLKPGGVLVVSELTWTTASRPAEVQAHWDDEYPEVDLASAKMALLERHGYSPRGYFVLPQQCWLDNYYLPLQDGFESFLHRNGHSQAARAVVAAETSEIELYRQYRQYYSYGVYIARKPE